MQVHGSAAMVDPGAAPSPARPAGRRGFGGVVMAFARTFRAFYRRPGRLVENSSGEASRDLIAPLPFFIISLGFFCLVFYGAVWLLYGAAWGQADFELPPAFGFAMPILRVIPVGTIVLIVTALLVTTVVSYSVGRMFRYDIGFRPLLGINAYGLAALHLTMAPVLVILFAVLGRQSGAIVQVVVTVALLALTIYAYYWLSAAWKLAFGLPRWLGVLVLIVCWAALSLSQTLGPMPVQSFNIVSGSMEPTVAVGEIVLANKWVYHWREPRRGEIVVFRYPKDERITYIKRVVGLPGDMVQYLRGRLEHQWKAA